MRKKKKFDLLLKDDQPHEAFKFKMPTKQEQLEFIKQINDAAKSKIPTFAEIAEMQERDIARRRKEYADDIAEAIVKKQAEFQAPNSTVTTENNNKLNSEQASTSSNKPRKKLIPLKRETNEALLLIYELLKEKDVSYLDELPAAKAWGLIVAQQFKSDLIKTYPINTKGEIIFNSGEKSSKQEFSKKYQSRFE